VIEDAAMARQFQQLPQNENLVHQSDQTPKRPIGEIRRLTDGRQRVDGSLGHKIFEHDRCPFPVTTDDFAARKSPWPRLEKRTERCATKSRFRSNPFSGRPMQ
jgi:hypothetical protein